MRLLACALFFAAVSDCRRRHPEDELPELDAPVRASEDAKSEGSGAERTRPVLGGPQMQAALRVKATLNGGPLPEGVSCEVAVYQQDSSVSKRGSGECGASIALEPGLVDVDVHLSAPGGFETHKRLKGERVGGEPREIAVDVPWAIGRLRVSHLETADVRSCQVAIKDTALNGLDSRTFTLPVGTYTADFNCTGPSGSITASVPMQIVTQGRDTVTVMKIAPGVAARQVGLAAVTGPTVAIPRPITSQWGVPGLPQLAPGPTGPQSYGTGDVNPQALQPTQRAQSNSTEDLTVQSYNGF